MKAKMKISGRKMVCIGTLVVVISGTLLALNLLNNYIETKATKAGKALNSLEGTEK